MKDLFDFNHIEPNIDKKQKKNLKSFINITTNFGGVTKKLLNGSKKLILLSI